MDAEDEDEDEIAGEAVAEGQAAVAVPGRRPQEKKTQADRNREKRRRDAEEELAARRSLKKQRRELDSVKQYHVEIARQEALQVGLSLGHRLRHAVHRLHGFWQRWVHLPRLKSCWLLEVWDGVIV